MDISRKNQEQVAGDNSTQNQVVGDNTHQVIIDTQNNTVTHNSYTITSIPASEIVTLTTTVSTQVTQQALALCTQVAEKTVLARMNAFEQVWTPRISSMENVVSHLTDPKFQFMIRDANITAAKSTRAEDLNMLSELLACHIEKGSDIKIDAGINRAINIVNEVDIDSLCALTIVLAITNIIPNSGNANAGLKVLNDLYAKLLICTLPEGDDWIDNLNVVGAINIESGNLKKIDKLITSILDGYVCAGIKSGTEGHKQALEILRNHGYADSELAQNDFLPNHVRLTTVDLSSLKPELKPIADLYSKDQASLDVVKANFMSMWDSYEILRVIHEWFDNIPIFFRINSVGKALAQTNAKRCYPSFPDLIK